jgi:hypothetical protein
MAPPYPSPGRKLREVNPAIARKKAALRLLFSFVLAPDARQQVVAF